MGYSDRVSISVLVGKTIDEIIGAVGGEEISIRCSDGAAYKMLHNQDCCESVDIDDICGDMSDLIGLPITLAEESVSSKDDADCPPSPEPKSYEPDSYTWTFYRLGTAKGLVTIRWYGCSNGYYGEGVDFEEVK